jgi:hypothetical protein
MIAFSRRSVNSTTPACAGRNSGTVPAWTVPGNSGPCGHYRREGQRVKLRKRAKATTAEFGRGSTPFGALRIEKIRCPQDPQGCRLTGQQVGTMLT